MRRVQSLQATQQHGCTQEVGDEAEAEDDVDEAARRLLGETDARLPMSPGELAAVWEAYGLEMDDELIGELSEAEADAVLGMSVMVLGDSCAQMSLASRASSIGFP